MENGIYQVSAKMGILVQDGIGRLARPYGDKGEWYVCRTDKSAAPLNAEQTAALLKAGLAANQTLIWVE